MKFDIQPTAAFIQDYVDDYEMRNPYDKLRFTASYDLVKCIPKNETFGDIFIKASYINSAFKTVIWDIDTVAERIYECLVLDRKAYLDEQLCKGEPGIIDEITRCYERANYSFATKYCHSHNPKDFPIYDSFVDLSLWHYNSIFSKMEGFPKFKHKELKNYRRFKEVFFQFKRFANCENYPNSVIDRFLWAMGKEIAVYNKKGKKFDSK